MPVAVPAVRDPVAELVAAARSSARTASGLTSVPQESPTGRERGDADAAGAHERVGDQLAGRVLCRISTSETAGGFSAG